ncbi:MAG: hypothetical protein JXA68_03855, partial [Ignavibacteriales bacterium]|nr:hypothetical protein [Ignavibacteriales bacterium]
MKINPIILFIISFLLSSIILSQPQEGDYMASFSGDWENKDIWSKFTGGVWNLPPNPPPSSSDNVITIPSGKTVTITTDIDADQLKVDGTLDVQLAGGLTINNGVGDDLDVRGTLINAGSILFISSPHCIIAGTYQHNFTTIAGYIPPFVWKETSTCEIIGYTTYTGHMDVDAQAFQNVVWNCEGQENQVVLDSNFSNIQENFTIISTGKTGSLRLSYGKNYVVNGNFRQEGGALVLAYSMSSGELHIKGNAEFVNGGVASGFYPSTGRIYLIGTAEADLLIEDDYLFDTGVESNFEIIIDNNDIRNLQKNANIDGAFLSLYGKLICNQYIIIGDPLSRFKMYPGSTLNTAHTQGIHPSSIKLGSIQTGSRIYESDATYLYSCMGEQQSGTGIPDTVMKLGKINGYFVALEKDITISDTLALDGGSISLYDEYNLSLLVDAIITGTFSNNNMVIVEDIESYLTRYIDEGGAYLYPVGTENGGTYSYTPAYIKVASGIFSPDSKISVSLDNLKHPNNYSKYNYLTRYWLVRISDITDILYFGRLTYDDIDVVGDENEIHLGYKVSGGEFVEGSLSNTTTNELDIPEFIEEDCDFTGVDLSDVI